MTERDLTSISEIAVAAGLRASALRYYERRGLISPTSRVAGRRHYDPAVLQRLAAIALLQEVGFTISEVGQLLDPVAGRQDWQGMAEQKLEEIETHLARVEAARALLTAALGCSCSSFDTCDLVSSRRGEHGKVVQSLTLRGAPPTRGGAARLQSGVRGRESRLK